MFWIKQRSTKANCVKSLFWLESTHYLLNIWQESLIGQGDSGSLKDPERVSRSNQEQKPVFHH